MSTYKLTLLMLLTIYKMTNCQYISSYRMTWLALISYSNKAACAERSSGSRKLLRPTPTRRNRCCGPRATRSRSESAIAVSCRQEEGGDDGVWLRVRILNSAVFNFSTTVL